MRAGAILTIVMTLTVVGCGTGSDSSRAATDPTASSVATTSGSTIPQTTTTTTTSPPTTAPQDQTVVAGIAVDRSALREPGTPLGTGIEVQPGTVLVETPFPYVHHQVDPPEATGWQAVLVVTGDPVEVWDRYADALGVGALAPATSSCRVMAYEPTDPHRPTTTTATNPPTSTADPGSSRPRSRFLTEGPVVGENHLTCWMRVPGASMSLEVGAPACWTQDSPHPCFDRPISHLWIRVTSSSLIGQPIAADADVELGAAGLPRFADEIPTGPIRRPNLPPMEGSHLPVAGEPLDDLIDPFLSSPRYVAEVDRVPEGAWSLVAPAMIVHCNSGLIAVLHQRGDPPDAIRIFDRAASDDDDMVFRETGDWSAGFIATAGGYYFDVFAVPSEQGGSNVLIYECGD